MRVNLTSPFFRLNSGPDAVSALSSDYIHRLFETLVRGDVQATLAVCDPHIIYSIPFFPGLPVLGHEGVGKITAVMAQQLQTSSFQLSRLDIEDCMASVDVLFRHRYKDGSRLEYFHRCNLEVHNGLVCRFQATSLGMPERAANARDALVSDEGTDRAFTERNRCAPESCRFLANPPGQCDQRQPDPIRSSYRDELGRLMLTLVDGPEKFIVSRSHEHLFVRARH